MRKFINLIWDHVKISIEKLILGEARCYNYDRKLQLIFCLFLSRQRVVCFPWPSREGDVTYNPAFSISTNILREKWVVLLSESKFKVCVKAMITSLKFQKTISSKIPSILTKVRLKFHSTLLDFDFYFNRFQSKSYPNPNPREDNFYFENFD